MYSSQSSLSPNESESINANLLSNEDSDKSESTECASPPRKRKLNLNPRLESVKDLHTMKKLDRKTTIEYPTICPAISKQRPIENVGNLLIAVADSGKLFMKSYRMTLSYAKDPDENWEDSELETNSQKSNNLTSGVVKTKTKTKKDEQILLQILDSEDGMYKVSLWFNGQYFRGSEYLRLNRLLLENPLGTSNLGLEELIFFTLMRKASDSEIRDHVLKWKKMEDLLRPNNKALGGWSPIRGYEYLPMLPTEISEVVKKGTFSEIPCYVPPFFLGDVYPAGVDQIYRINFMDKLRHYGHEILGVMSQGNNRMKRICIAAQVVQDKTHLYEKMYSSSNARGDAKDPSPERLTTDLNSRIPASSSSSSSSSISSSTKDSPLSSRQLLTTKEGLENPTLEASEEDSGSDQEAERSVNRKLFWN